MGHFKGKIGNAHARCHVTGWYGVIRNHIFGISDPQFAYSLYNFYGATTTIKGSLHGSTPIVKRFSVENFQSRQNRAQNGGFSGITGC